MARVKIPATDRIKAELVDLQESDLEAIRDFCRHLLSNRKADARRRKPAQDAELPKQGSL